MGHKYRQGERLRKRPPATARAARRQPATGQPLFSTGGTGLGGEIDENFSSGAAKLADLGTSCLAQDNKIIIKRQ